MPSQLSENLIEIAAEQLDPAKWAAIQILKGGRPDMTGEEAAIMIEQVFREALRMSQNRVTRECRRLLAMPNWEHRCQADISRQIYEIKKSVCEIDGVKLKIEDALRFETDLPRQQKPELEI